MFSLTQKVRKTKPVIVESESEGKSFDSNVENKTKQKNWRTKLCYIPPTPFFPSCFLRACQFRRLPQITFNKLLNVQKQTQKQKLKQKQRQPFAWREDTAVYFLNYLFKDKSIQSLRCLEIKIILIYQKNEIRFWKSLVNLKVLKYYTLKIEL